MTDQTNPTTSDPGAPEPGTPEPTTPEAAPAEPGTPEPTAPEGAPAAPTEPEPPAEEQGGDVTEPELASFADIENADGASLDEAGFNAVSDLFKEAGVPLTKDMAQKLVDIEKGRMAAFAEEQQKQFKEQKEAWAQQVRDDKELGGEKFDENISVAQEAAAKLASPELMELLNQTGLGNHPEMVRLFHKLAPYVREERPGAQARRPVNPQSSRLELLYGKTGN